MRFIASTNRSIPAGLAGVNLKGFLVFCFIGSYLWSYFLAWVGMAFGSHWDKVKDYMHYVSVALVFVIVFMIARWFLKNLNNKR